MNEVLAHIFKNCEPVPEAGCWLWTGSSHHRDGYAVRHFRRNGKEVKIQAHRQAWESVNGPIPEGMLVLHKCDTRLCINPDHIFLGTQADNMRDMKHKGRGRVGKRQKRLPNDIVHAIRASTGSVRGVARLYGCTPGAVRYIRRKSND